MYSTTYAAIIVNILSFILPKMGITIGSDALTTTIQTVAIVGSGIVVMYKRYKQGGVTAMGVKTV